MSQRLKISESNKLNNILITGSTGMIGKNLSIYLNNSKKDFFFTPNSKELNLEHPEKIEKFIKDKKINFVIHLAAKVGGIQANIDNNLDFYVYNNMINNNLIKVCYDSKVKKLLNVASTCVYPTNISKKLKEEMLFSGKLEKTNEGYALSKLNAIKYCMFINQQNNSYKYKSIIPCNMYGLYDKFDKIQSHLVPAVIMKIINARIKKQKKIEIWGSGNARREFLFAEDFAKIILKIVNQFNNTPEIMNIGTGKDYKIVDYYNFVKDLVKWDGEWVFNREKPEGMKRKIADVSIQKKFNLMPETSIKEGLVKTIDFYKKKINYEKKI